MDAFREWALCLIISAVAGGVVCAVSPRGATDKTVRTVIGIFIVVTVCTPLARLAKADFEYTFAASYNGEDSGEKLNELILENCKTAVENALKPVAEKYSISIVRVELNVFVDDNNRINIHNIHLEVSEEDSGNISLFQMEAEKISGVPVKISID